MMKLPMLALVPALLTGCAGHGVSVDAGDRSVLTSDQLEAASLTWAHETISRLRPEWLRTRGSTSLTRASASDVVIYMDGMRFGGPDSLHSIRVAEIAEIRYMTGPEATNRFGTGVSGGVIHIRTK
jgi:hypothetical protein